MRLSFGGEAGSSLVMVIGLVAVTLVIGAAVSSVVVNDYKQNIRAESGIQAYYLARSGVEVARALLGTAQGQDFRGVLCGSIEVEGDSTAFSKADDFTDEEGEDGGLSLYEELKTHLFDLKADLEGSPNVIVGIADGPNEVIRIVSIGTAKGVSKSITLDLQSSSDDGGAGSTGAPLDMAVFADEGIELTGSARITGNAGTNATSEDSVSFGWATEITGDLYLIDGVEAEYVIDRPSKWSPIDSHVGGIVYMDRERTYNWPEYPDFPAELPERGALEAGWRPAPPYSISEDGYYEEIVVKSTLLIHTAPGENRVIRTNSLSVSGSGQIQLSGGGRVLLYVDESLAVSGSGKINAGGDSGSLIIYYGGADEVSLGGDTAIVGSLYANTASLNLGGSQTVTGSILTGGSSVTLSGAASSVVRAVYAPYAAVTLKGGSNITGVVICDSFSAQGGARVTYAEVEQAAFPLVIGAGDGQHRDLVWRP